MRCETGDVNDGHRTSTIPRPRTDVTSAATRAKRGSTKPSAHGEVPADKHSSLLSDFTTPIAREKQLFPQRRGRLVLGVFATLIVVAIGAALFVLPIKSWMKQRDQLTTRSSELATLNAANNQLQTEVDRLQTDGGIKEAAREEIDFVEKGEQRITVLPVGPASTTLPTGWPYDLVTQIVAIRQAQAAAAVTTATPVPTAAPTTAPFAPTNTALPTTGP